MRGVDTLVQVDVVVPEPLAYAISNAMEEAGYGVAFDAFAVAPHRR